MCLVSVVCFVRIFTDNLSTSGMNITSLAAKRRKRSVAHCSTLNSCYFQFIVHSVQSRELNVIAKIIAACW